MPKEDTTMRWFTTLFKSARRRICLNVESLEDRQLMTVGLGLAVSQPVRAGPPRGIITGRVLDDLPGLAMKFARHQGPTLLALNFDGSTRDNAKPYLSTTGDREREIQTLVYRTSEIFA